MNLQLIKDGSGNDTGVFVHMSDWETVTQNHEDLKALLPNATIATRHTKLSDLAGTLSIDAANTMLKYVEESRNEWEERLEKQFR